ncbi:hypothetical protein GDO81_025697 [Engystomops pustulosus]|uniref:Uncharacterized protein n=1 Tax=Engystomops pustulosus TaxID=76066 RepID=A0AAV6ZLR8_ENGPU|nr:hypothetical protein GDO81_025697 [Engystomops pustulosus]
MKQGLLSLVQLALASRGIEHMCSEARYPDPRNSAHARGCFTLPLHHECA